MNNKGYMTVFVSLIMSCMLILGLCICRVVSVNMAQSKAVICGNTALSDVKAGYNKYIYDNYHILLFDASAGGKGEAAIEEQIIENMKKNLGDGYEVDDVIIESYTSIMDDGCHSLKEQISDYVAYAAVEYGADYILGQTNGVDGTLPDEVAEGLESAAAGEAKEEPEDENEQKENTGDGEDEENSNKDPRKFFTGKNSVGLFLLMLPEGMNPSTEAVELDGLPSKSRLILSDKFSIDYSFSDAKALEGDVEAYSSWKDNLLDAGYSAVYARQVFNCATNTTVRENTVFQNEIEYIISGKDTDLYNLKAVAEKIAATRLPVNYAYLMSSKSKCAVIKNFSVPLSFVTPVPEFVIRNLIAGAWAYVEAIVETRTLLSGKKLEFAKTDANWITDLDNLEDTIKNNVEGDDKGLSYEDYLMILLAVNKDKTYYRMLDLMQLNAEKNGYAIDMKNGAVELTTAMGVRYKGYDCSFRLSLGY